MRSVQVILDFTPNPNSLKYSINVEVSPQAIFFKSPQQAAKDSLLATQLFTIDGVISVLLGDFFITVTKTEDSDWDFIHKNCQEMIEEFLMNETSIFLRPLNEIFIESEKEKTDAEKRICEILDQEIRPSIALDGGDISFDRFEHGVLYLELKGACSGCPSSSMTLKDGIEQRLKTEIPEILEVVST
jgi:Fe-S cluster biogenesis protein NfuA